jgi:protoporphyrinogen/coproporphyrinogen III oxidase
MPRIVIVGGGISGLAALEELTRTSTDIDVTLLEASPRLGGHIRTETHNGFVMEAGPDVLLAAKPAAIELAKRVGLGDRLCGTNPTAKGSYILSEGRLLPLPDGLTGLVPSKFGPFATTPLISWRGKLRVAMEYFIAPRRTDADESIEQFAVRRLGREMYEKLVEPLLSGISAGDGARLSIDAMFPQLRAMERDSGGLARGMFAAKRKANKNPPAKRGSAFIAFPNGLQELVDAVENTVRARQVSSRHVDIRTNARVASVCAGDVSRYVLTLEDGSIVEADELIVATPAYAAAEMLRGVAPVLSDRLDTIEYASSVTITLVYPRSAISRPLDSTGYVVPRIENRPVLACTFASAKFAGRAPDSHAMFRLFLGGANRGEFSETPEADLIGIARCEMHEVLGISVAPSFVRINRFKRAMPQYIVGHRARMAEIAATVASMEGLELAGAVYQGVGIPDCVRSGVDAAKRALAATAAMSPLTSAAS